MSSGAPIDDFAIGTRLDTSADAPYLDCAYTLQEYAGRPRRKRSTGKATWPGRKQVYRRVGADGRINGDILTLEDDLQASEPLLLQPVMRAGQRLATSPPVSEIRQHATAELERLPEPLRQRQVNHPIRSRYRRPLHDLADAVDRWTSAPLSR